MFDFLKGSRKARPPPRTTRYKFHGVLIKANSEFVCFAATALQDRRYLSDEAPHLPLAGCTDLQSCKCVYEHLDDRRTGDVRRESDDGLPLRDHPYNYRHGEGRRVTDRTQLRNRKQTMPI